eukprot:comp22478_c0_seq1/m.55621 comp22478_c0_seq1/g.55621  ORF comp22478_c0_seq1/g.55621 comp22478_c0_seq1/m.55621 type:complete len:497 (-) comp22478_c0_seq1:2609-4099(-)
MAPKSTPTSTTISTTRSDSTQRTTTRPKSSWSLLILWKDSSATSPISILACPPRSRPLSHSSCRAQSQQPQDPRARTETPFSTASATPTRPASLAKAASTPQTARSTAANSASASAQTRAPHPSSPRAPSLTAQTCSLLQDTPRQHPQTLQPSQPRQPLLLPLATRGPTQADPLSTPPSRSLSPPSRSRAHLSTDRHHCRQEAQCQAQRPTPCPPGTRATRSPCIRQSTPAPASAREAHRRHPQRLFPNQISKKTHSTMPPRQFRRRPSQVQAHPSETPRQPLRPRHRHPHQWVPRHPAAISAMFRQQRARMQCFHRSKTRKQARQPPSRARRRRAGISPASPRPASQTPHRSAHRICPRSAARSSPQQPLQTQTQVVQRRHPCPPPRSRLQSLFLPTYLHPLSRGQSEQHSQRAHRHRYRRSLDITQRTQHQRPLQPRSISLRHLTSSTTTITICRIRWSPSMHSRAASAAQACRCRRTLMSASSTAACASRGSQ